MRNALPIGLAQGAKVTRRIESGELLSLSSVEPDPSLRIVQVRKLQDEMVG
jgi:predicted homoserine dehydrogenase-like protein